MSLQKAVLPYSLNTPLLSDAPHKFRTLWLPDAAQMDHTANTASGPPQSPVGGPQCRQCSFDVTPPKPMPRFCTTA